MNAHECRRWGVGSRTVIASSTICPFFTSCSRKPLVPSQASALAKRGRTELYSFRPGSTCALRWSAPLPSSLPPVNGPPSRPPSRHRPAPPPACVGRVLNLLGELELLQLYGRALSHRHCRPHVKRAKPADADDRARTPCRRRHRGSSPAAARICIGRWLLERELHERVLLRIDKYGSAGLLEEPQLDLAAAGLAPVDPPAGRIKPHPLTKWPAPRHLNTPPTRRPSAKQATDRSAAVQVLSACWLVAREEGVLRGAQPK